MTKERGGGREREGESIFKTKDRLGDNEWCKPDDLLASAVRPHTHTWPPFLLLSLPLSTSLSFSVWPDRLIKTEERFIFAGPECFTSYNGVEGAGNSKAVE